MVRSENLPGAVSTGNESAFATWGPFAVHHTWLILLKQLPSGRLFALTVSGYGAPRPLFGRHPFTSLHTGNFFHKQPVDLFLLSGRLS